MVTIVLLSISGQPSHIIVHRFQISVNEVSKRNPINCFLSTFKNSSLKGSSLKISLLKKISCLKGTPEPAPIQFMFIVSAWQE